jgi:DnaJ-class molecular chaperone
MREPCPECDEEGFNSAAPNNGKCNKCHGTGIADLVEAIITMDGNQCPRCDGDGICPRCRGDGYIYD